MYRTRTTKKNNKKFKGKNQVTYKRILIRVTPDLSMESLKTRRTYTIFYYKLKLEMPAKIVITSKNFNQHKWKKKDIPC